MNTTNRQIKKPTVFTQRMAAKYTKAKEGVIPAGYKAIGAEAFQKNGIDNIKFPAGLKESVNANILYVADAYDRMTAMKSFEEPTSEVKAVRELLADEERYNKKIVNALIHGISILYPGVCVELSNGEKGLVITGNEENIFEPTVLDFRNNNLYDLSDPSVKQTVEIADVMKTMDNRIKLDKSLLEEYQAN